MKRQGTLEEISDGKLYGANDMVRADCGDCAGCWACCCGMGSSVILDPLDIWRLTENLGFSFEELLSECLELKVVDGIILPNLKMSEDTDCCVFLKNGRCRIHESRPGVCRLFPLGRYYTEEGFHYFLQTHECKKESRSKVKVRKWIDTPDLKRYESYIWDWHCLLKAIQKEIEQTNQSRERVRELNMMVLNLFFMKSYENGRDFYGQFKERIFIAGEMVTNSETFKRQQNFDNLQQEF